MMTACGRSSKRNCGTAACGVVIQMNLVLDSGVLGQLCHPHNVRNRPVVEWLVRLLRHGDTPIQVFIPEIADYELRRKLLHLVRKGQASVRSIERLDDLERLLDYLPLDTEVMHQAAALWAEARRLGSPTAGENALDGDVILAAQAMAVDGVVVTTNRKHLSRFVPTKEWSDIVT
jgi:predicted nucleic acid-binding protein